LTLFSKIFLERGSISLKDNRPIAETLIEDIDGDDPLFCWTIDFEHLRSVSVRFPNFLVLACSSFWVRRSIRVPGDVLGIPSTDKKVPQISIWIVRASARSCRLLPPSLEAPNRKAIFLQNYGSLFSLQSVIFLQISTEVKDKWKEKNFLISPPISTHFRPTWYGTVVNTFPSFSSFQGG
jgi:hypothetical protein